MRSPRGGGGNNLLYGAGDGYNGQLGTALGTLPDCSRICAETFQPISVVGDPNIIDIFAGGDNSAAIDSAHTLWTVGHNDKGQLGNGTNSNTPQFAFAPVAYLVKSAALGGSHSALVDLNGEVNTTGDDAYGQLAKDNNSLDKTIFGKTFDSNGDPMVALLENEVSAGSRHTIAVVGNALYVAGENYQIGIGNSSGTTNSFTEIAQLGATVEKAFAGYDRTFAIDTSGYLWGAGGNNGIGLGYLGINDNTNEFVLTFQKAQVDMGGGVRDLQDVSAAAIGYAHTLAIAEGGLLFGAGDNSYGQLGLGAKSDTNKVFVPIDLPTLQ